MFSATAERGTLAMLLKSQTRAAEYHAKASDAAARAASSDLQRVRELHALAASRWAQLADLEDRRTLSLARRFDRAARAGAASTPAVVEEAACTA
jgi:hypothetical protein